MEESRGKLLLNGVEVEFDLFDADTAEAYDDAVAAFNERLTEAPRNSALGDVLRFQCESVFTFIDDIFGDGFHRTLFGDRVNFADCLDVFGAIQGEASCLLEKIDALKAKHMPGKAHNRAERRASGKSRQ